MITPLYAALLALVFLVLSGRVIAYRISHRLSLGDSGDKGLLKRMRAQGNFAEYVPLGLILMLLVELQDAAPVVLHLIGGALLLGRLLHGYGFSSYPQKMILRRAGMVANLIAYLVAIFWILIHAVSAA